MDSDCPSLFGNTGFCPAENLCPCTMPSPEDARIPVNSGVMTPSGPTLQDTCPLRLPDPELGYQPLPGFVVDAVVCAIDEELNAMCQENQRSVNRKYWRKIGRKLLGAEDSASPVIVPTRAGAGKSTWIEAFCRAFIRLRQEQPDVADWLGRIALVFQKRETLNDLAETLNTLHVGSMVALQTCGPDAKRRGLCCNESVTDFEDCPGRDCPCADSCPILNGLLLAQTAPIVGMTQKRFLTMRQRGTLSNILCFDDADGHPRCRRFLLFDEKIEIVPISTLNKIKINEASTALEKLSAQQGCSDASISYFQHQLGFLVDQPFRVLRNQCNAQRSRFPAGFIDLPADAVRSSSAARDQAGSYLDQLNKFRANLTPYRHSAPELPHVLDTMELLYQAPSVIFCREGGFSLTHIGGPSICFPDCLSIVFDATAAVDADYTPLLNQCRILKDTDDPHKARMILHSYSDPIFNCSRTSLATSSWKLPVFAQLIAELVRRQKGPTFLCCYRAFKDSLRQLLLEHLGEELLSRQVPHLHKPDGSKCLPYFGGTNGSNAFLNCSSVILLGYPRLDPQQYFLNACAAYGTERLAAELDELRSDTALSRLPSVVAYETRHLAARLEQEIYRCAYRNRSCTDDIHVYLFDPPPAVLSILRDRLNAEVDNIPDVPSFFNEARITAYSAPEGFTAAQRLINFIQNWDGARMPVSDIRDRLAISPSGWKDLMKRQDIKDIRNTYRVSVSGRGPNCCWYKNSI